MNALLALCLLCQPPAPDLTPRIFDIRAYGAAPDDNLPDDAGINAAVSACAAAGGGVVSLPRGRYVLDGPVNLRDCTGVTLRGDGPATVLGSGGYCGPLVAVGMPCASARAAMRPASPLTTSGPKRSAATLGAMALAVTGHPLQFGWTSPGNAPDYWRGPAPLTWDLAFSLPSTPFQWATVAGLMDAAQNPAPWLIRYADGAVVLDLRMASDAVQFHRLAVPLGAGPVYRVSFQYDPGSGRAAGWLDGRLVTTAFAPGWGSGTPGALAGSNGVDPFGVGYAGPRADGTGFGGIADLVLHGLRVCRAAVYQWDGPNPGAQAFAVQPALPVTDDTRFFTGADQVVPPGSLVGLLPLDPEPPGSAWVSCSSYRGRGLMAWCPPLTTIAVGTNRVAVEDMTLANAVQPGVLLGRHSAVALRRLVIAGGSQAIGSMPLMNSYPLTVDDCDLSGWDAAVVSFRQMVDARNLVLSGIGRHGVRAAGGNSSWTNVKVWRSAEYVESVFSFTGGDDGMNHSLRNVLYDDEDFAPTRAVVDCLQGSAQRGLLTIDGLAASALAPGASLVRLTGSGRAAPYRVDAKGLTVFGACPVALRVDGAAGQWHGAVDCSQLWPGKVEGDAGQIAVTPPTTLYKPAAPEPAPVQTKPAARP